MLASGELKGGLGPCCLSGLGLWVEVTRPWLLWPACWVCPLAPLVLLLSTLWLPSCGAGRPLSLWLALPASVPGSNLGSGARLPGQQRSSFHPVCDCLKPLNPGVPRAPPPWDGESQACLWSHRGPEAAASQSSGSRAGQAVTTVPLPSFAVRTEHRIPKPSPIVVTGLRPEFPALHLVNSLACVNLCERKLTLLSLLLTQWKLHQARSDPHPNLLGPFARPSQFV